MAVTHADLEIGRSCKALGSKLGTSILILCAAMGTMAFILCLIAERTRSEVLWKKEPKLLECIYTHSAKTATACSSGALLALTLSMVLSQTYMGIALCNPPSREKARPLYVWTSNYSRASNLRWKAAIYFITSWMSFAVAAVLLVIGVTVEAEDNVDYEGMHLKCLVVRQGLFAVAGIFALSCTTLCVGFYLTALQTQEIEETEAMVREEVLQASSMASPAATPAPNHEVFVAGMSQQSETEPSLEVLVRSLDGTPIKSPHSSPSLS